MGAGTRQKVLFLIDRFEGPHAGTEGQLFHLATALANAGIECHLVTLDPSEYLLQHGFPCPWSALQHRRLRDARTWRAMYRLGRCMAAQGFRIAHTFFNDASILAPPMLAAAGIRTVISRRDMGFWYTRGYTYMLRITGCWVSACVANSHAVAELTRAREHIPATRMRVIYNGLPLLAARSKSARDVAALREHGKLLVALVANLRPIKRIADLIEALSTIQHRCANLHAIVIGAGDSSTLMKRAQRLGVDQRIHFLGGRDDVADCLQCVDIGVLCSESEGFSNSLIEYMRAGLPSVCTSVGGNPEAIRHGETGFLYPVGDVRALASRLQELAGDSQLRTSMGQLARHDAQKRFSIEAMVQGHRRLYREVLEGRIGRGRREELHS